ncbi:YXWGXW repeat-containing protein [Pseudomonas sp. N40(2020)]|uniref:YXWGXW repeat-containing protein n=1 Tax=Pseudomonas sp. N40(2020) TaxID=2767798 RepID=UPI001656A810|nr:YXWGXW repeat-containing protein [Pseudomonas sp. N40(2020)]MBC8996951.1 YXWGXW repeat-containing protein [Pseudomonas sp. N40(2020)]
MSVLRSLSKWRKTWLLVPLTLAALASGPVFAQQVVIVQQAPPPMRMEVMPGPRHGYVWDQGHWRWQGRGYVWMPGHWQPVRYNAHWKPGHWQARGPNWFWVEGHWVR